MMRRFNEKRAREETVGRACAMAERAVREQRGYSDGEAAKVEALLASAEALGLGESIPREPVELLRHANAKPKNTRRGKT